MKELKSIWTKNWRSLLFALMLTGIMACLLLSYIGKCYGGNYKYAIMSSTYFGMPEEIRTELDMPYTFTDGKALGWDGQFYYYISNDLLDLKGTSIHVDAPAYRWQRVGLPFLARIISLIIFREYVTVPVYLFTNLLLLFAAAFVSAKYFLSKKYNLLWIVPWFFSIGVTITLFNALPDGAADALFIIAFIMLLKKQMPHYSLFMTLACLSREGYVIIAFAVFLLGLFGKIEDTEIIKNKKINIKNFFILSMPGVIFVLWYIYVSIHFGTLPYKQALGIQQLFLTAWPTYIIKAINSNNVLEFISLIVYILIIIVGLILSIKAGTQNKKFFVIAPYTFLVGSFGSTVMQHYSGYLKGISVLYFIIPLMALSLNKQEVKLEGTDEVLDFRRVLLVVLGLLMAFVFANSMQALKDRITYGWFQPEVAGSQEKRKPQVIEFANPLDDYSSKVEVVSDEKNALSNIPLSSLFVADYSILTIRVTNTSDSIWPNTMQSNGRGKMAVSYKWYKDTGNGIDPDSQIVEGGRTAFGKDVQPNETVNMGLYITYPKESGKYVLRLSVIQEGFAWFYNYNTGYVDINVQMN